MKVKAKQDYDRHELLGESLYKVAKGRYADMPEDIAEAGILEGLLERVSDEEFTLHLKKCQAAFQAAREGKEPEPVVETRRGRPKKTETAEAE